MQEKIIKFFHQIKQRLYEKLLRVGIKAKNISLITTAIKHGAILADDEMIDQTITLFTPKFRTPSALLTELENPALQFLSFLHSDTSVDLTAKNNVLVCWASINGFYNILKWLVDDIGADIRVSDDFCLRTASRYGYKQIVEFCLEHGADASACDNEAICVASAGGYFDIVGRLFYAGADIEARDNEPVCAAAFYGHFYLVEMLVIGGYCVDPHVRNDYIQFCSTYRWSGFFDSVVSDCYKDFERHGFNDYSAEDREYLVGSIREDIRKQVYTDFPQPTSDQFYLLEPVWISPRKYS